MFDRSYSWSTNITRTDILPKKAYSQMIWETENVFESTETITRIWNSSLIALLVGHTLYM